MKLGNTHVLQHCFWYIIGAHWAWLIALNLLLQIRILAFCLQPGQLSRLLLSQSPSPECSPSTADLVSLTWDSQIPTQSSTLRYEPGPGTLLRYEAAVCSVGWSHELLGSNVSEVTLPTPYSPVKSLQEESAVFAALLSCLVP